MEEIKRTEEGASIIMNIAMPLVPQKGKSVLLWLSGSFALPGRGTPHLVGALCAAVLCVHQAQAAVVSTNEPGVQLTLELRDGSRVVGKSLEDTLSFHSAALGDMKLAWAGIHSIEFAGTNTSAARLTATNGDVFGITLAAETLRVETGFGQTELPVKLIRSVKVALPAMAAAVAGGGIAQLAIELRDGSHVVGKGLDDSLGFHSSAMGDLKLTWAGIRSLEYAGTNTDVARLTATNGDVYEVQFAATAVHVETSFGKTELPVKLIRSVRVLMAGQSGQMPAGLVALWTGDGNAQDSAGSNNGTLNGGVTFRKSGAAQAFSFDGASGYVSVPHNSQWDFGNNPFSIALWANFNTPERGENLFGDDNGYGLGQNKWCLCHGTVFNGLSLHIAGPVVQNVGQIPFSPEAGKWYHIVLTREGSDWTFYTNGVVAGTARVSVTVPSTTAPLTIGVAEAQGFFNGLMGDVSIYNRALSEGDIQTLYGAGKWLDYQQ
jgi:hypothetical protein